MDIFSPQWIMVILAILTHMFTTIWWASRAITKLEDLTNSVLRLDKELEKRDIQITAIWKRIDDLRDMIGDKK